VNLLREKAERKQEAYLRSKGRERERKEEEDSDNFPFKMDKLQRYLKTPRASQTCKPEV
jgi:hypothetical protein